MKEEKKEVKGPEILSGFLFIFYDFKKKTLSNP
jgi:hypothetical protein